jgi:DNA-entry nuclease
MACIGTELMPTEERESIGSVKPTGWNQNKYPGIVDSDPPYLYNRCHLIGFQLTGENANEKNLVTGTRYMNVEGMLPYENMVADYIYATGNHVLYRVTPVFEGANLLCSGVQMEAYSVEDSGAGICFNVYCYNVQPGVVINYEDGSNWQDITYSISSDYQADDNSSTNSQRTLNQTQDNSTELSDAQTKTGDDDLSQGEKTDYTSTDSYDYLANKNTKKFHYPSCDSVTDMKEKNKLYFNGTRQELIDQGYEPCKRCNP